MENKIKATLSERLLSAAASPISIAPPPELLKDAAEYIEWLTKQNEVERKARHKAEDEIERLLDRRNMEPTLGEKFEVPDGRVVWWTPWGLVVQAVVTEADIQRGLELAKERGWLTTGKS